MLSWSDAPKYVRGNEVMFKNLDCWRYAIVIWIGCGFFAVCPSLPKIDDGSHAAEQRGIPESQPLKIALQDAILMAFEHNSLLNVERLTPDIRRTYEEEERSVFDPVFGGIADLNKSRVQEPQRGSSPVSEITTEEANLKVGVSQFFPTGTDVGVEISSTRTDSDWTHERYKTRFGLGVSQALLEGAGRDENLADLRSAQLGTRISQYELRGFSEALLAEVEAAYWEYALALRQIETVQKSLRIAEQQKLETEEMISVGKLAETELVATQAEIALRRQELINVRSTAEKRKLSLLRLVSPAGATLWEREIVMMNQPSLPDLTLGDVESYVSTALKMRADLNQARLGLEREDLEIIKTKNGLLPRMDFFIRLGKTGYADSFGSSVSDMAGDSYDFQVGANFIRQLGNRGPIAQNQRALLNREQIQRAVENLSQLIEMDVRTAYIEVGRTEQQIFASAETRRLEEEKLRVEKERFRVGRSTNFLVAQAQRDLLVSQLAENRAVVNYLNALVDLYRLEGSLLERNGIFMQN